MNDRTSFRLGKTLVIGYGNTLRRDDGVGPRVASAVAAWGLSGVETITTHQLNPEQAELLAHARLVLFVDARIAGEEETYRILPIRAASLRTDFGHASDPRTLLELAQTAYGRHPEAWSITVPATDMEMGEGLSPTAGREMEAALRHIARLVRDEPESDDGTNHPVADDRCTRSD